MRALLAVLPLLISCAESPAEPREEFLVSTVLGEMTVSGDPSLAPSLVLGLEGGHGTASALDRAATQTGRSRESFSGALTGWRIVLRDRQASYSLAQRVLYVDGRGEDAARYSVGHEAMHALAYVLGTCDQVGRVDHCGPFGPGYTLACERC